MKYIGITIDLKTSLWSNGINQNAIYLANLLKETGYIPYLIHTLQDPVEAVNNIKTISLKESKNIPFNLIIQLGFIITKPVFDIFKQKNKNVKLVHYKCGNEFLVDMESILFNANEKRTDTLINIKTNPVQKPHQIWSIPQMENTNLQYYAFMAGQDKATVVPFIWEPLAIEDYAVENGFETYSYRDLNTIGIMEPNLSVMKNCLLPLITIEQYYKKNKGLSKVRLFSTEKLRTNKRLLQIIGDLTIYKDKLISAEGRIPTLEAINKHIDIVLSWQWENNLNYLWLDVAWMGWPIIHNGSLCQDVGYYYDSFNINEAQLQIENVVKSHNTDSEYLERNRSIIKRYTHKNDILKQQYKMLVENVLNNKFERYSYDWKTNSIQ